MQKLEPRDAVLWPIEIGHVDRVIVVVSMNVILCQGETVDKKFEGLMEKKWTSVVRLQRKVGDVIIHRFTALIPINLSAIFFLLGRFLSGFSNYGIVWHSRE